MTWAMRLLGCFAAMLVAVACAAIAGLEPVADEGPVDSGGDAHADDGGTEAGTPADAGHDAPSCMQNGERGCRQAEDCCSGQCREDGMCVRKCQMPPPAEGTCPSSGEPDCCIGFWCGGGSILQPTCKPCTPSGQPAARNVLGIPIERSCCSRKVRDGTCE